MINKIDQSKRLARLLDVTSAGLARRRGLPIVIGILLVIVALAPLVTIGLSLFGAAVDLIQQLRQTGGARDALRSLL